MAIANEVADDRVDLLLHEVREMKELLQDLAHRSLAKDWYTTAEAAAMLGKAEFTVREWCRQGRIHAEKRGSGRGKYQSWVVSHAELQRYQREGLVPPR
jgi:transposase